MYQVFLSLQKEATTVSRRLLVVHRNVGDVHCSVAIPEENSKSMTVNETETDTDSESIQKNRNIVKR